MFAVVLCMLSCTNGVDVACDCTDACQPAALVEPIITVGSGLPGSCTEETLKDAVVMLNDSEGGSIIFSCGAADRTITLKKELQIKKNIIIDGGGLVSISGDNATRVIHADNYVNLVVQNITIANARADEYGAAVYMPWFGSLKVINTTFSNNHCTFTGPDRGGGALYAGGLSEFVVANCIFSGNRGSNGGAVCINDSNTMIVDSTFTNNAAHGTGGGADAGPSGQGGIGGAVYIDGMNRDAVKPFILCRSVFRGNRSNDHGSAVFRYAYKNESTTINQCTFDDNHVDGSGSGLGALYHEAAPLTLMNSTFSSNSTNLHAGALFLGSQTPATIINCTFTGNEVPQVGGGIFAGNNRVSITNCTFTDHYADYAPAIFCEKGLVTLKNTILANNTAVGPYNGTSCNKTLIDGGSNIQWPRQRANGTVDTPCTAGVVFADPLLLALGDYGGPTQTMALADESPAIDAARGCPATDQRGEPRGQTCDAGAYEAQAK
jgi:hypothetical protein